VFHHVSNLQHLTWLRSHSFSEMEQGMQRSDFAGRNSQLSVCALTQPQDG
jgi:hypothetical protein